MKPILVYIAAPYTQGDVVVNVRRAMDEWDALFAAGLYPFCPHLTHFLHLVHPRPYEDWMRYDQVWIPLCRALIRLPGPSTGADEEVRYANSLGIPVFYNRKDLFTWAKLQ